LRFRVVGKQDRDQRLELESATAARMALRRMEVLRHQRPKCETGARRSVASTSHMIPSHITALGQIQPSLPVTEDQHLTA
jgi:hypothetical protein